MAQTSRQDPDLIKTEIGLWCKFAHVSAKGISISLFLWPEEDLSAKSKAARCWAVSSCKDEVTYKKPLIQTWLNSLCSADERNRGGAGSTAIFLGMRLTSLRRKAELRKRYEVHHFACMDLVDLLGNLNQAIGLPQRGNQPGAVAWKLRDLQLPLVGSH